MIICQHLTPIKPDLVLEIIKNEICSPNFGLLSKRDSYQQQTIILTLSLLANKSEYFELCSQLMIKLIEFNIRLPQLDQVRHALQNFFNPPFADTNVSLEQKKSLISKLIWNDEFNYRNLGLELLEGALNKTVFINYTFDIYGAKPFESALEMSEQFFFSWYKEFIDLAVVAGTDEDNYVRTNVLRFFPKSFNWMWNHELLVEYLIGSAKKIREKYFWRDGWFAVREMMAFHSLEPKRNEEDNKKFEKYLELEEVLKPRTLQEKISAIVLYPTEEFLYFDDKFDPNDSSTHQNCKENLDELSKKLGQEYSKNKLKLIDLGSELIQSDRNLLESFGIGLTIGTDNPKALWAEMLELCQSHYSESSLSDTLQFNTQILCGFIEQIDKVDSSSARKYLEIAKNSDLLRNHLLWLHPTESFNEADFSRCMSIIDHPCINPIIFSCLLLSHEVSILTKDKNIQIMKKLMEKSVGPFAILLAISARLRNEPEITNWFEIEYAQFGIESATKIIKNNPSGLDEIAKFDPELMDNCLRNDLSESVIDEWIDSLFEIIDDFVPIKFIESLSVQYTASRFSSQFLEKFFDNNTVSQETREPILSTDVDGKLFSKIEMAELIKWCKNYKTKEMFEIIALALSPLEQKEGEQAYQLTKRVKEFIVNSPNPSVILRCFLKRIEPRSWSGDYLDEVNLRLEAFKELETNSNKQVAQAARELFQNLDEFESKWQQQAVDFKDRLQFGFE